jgi:prepilin-type N-terminal cleavage/methylation domain-containing protein
MKNRHLKSPIHRSQGITLIEILVVLGLLAILISFAMPSASKTASRAELKAAVENVQYSFQQARNLARATESKISVSIPIAREGSVQTIHFSSLSRGKHKNIPGMQDYSLPDDLVMISDQDSFMFDQRGLVESPGQVLLVSRLEETVNSTININ